jgi:hypothetical protein
MPAYFPTCAQRHPLVATKVFLDSAPRMWGAKDTILRHAGCLATQRRRPHCCAMNAGAVPLRLR